MADSTAQVLSSEIRKKGGVEKTITNYIQLLKISNILICMYNPYAEHRRCYWVNKGAKVWLESNFWKMGHEFRLWGGGFMAETWGCVTVWEKRPQAGKPHMQRSGGKNRLGREEGQKTRVPGEQWKNGNTGSRDCKETETRKGLDNAGQQPGVAQ